MSMFKLIMQRQGDDCTEVASCAFCAQPFVLEKPKLFASRFWEKNDTNAIGEKPGHKIKEKPKTVKANFFLITSFVELQHIIWVSKYSDDLIFYRLHSIVIINTGHICCAVHLILVAYKIICLAVCTFNPLPHFVLTLSASLS